MVKREKELEGDRNHEIKEASRREGVSARNYNEDEKKE